MPRAISVKHQKPLDFWLLCSFVILVFLIGGSSRASMQSLAILRPIAVLACGYGFWGLTRDHIQNYKYLFGFTAAVFGVVAIQMIPLPPSVWALLPGRDVLVEVDRIAQLGAVWRPISMVPPATANIFYALFVPLAVLLLAVKITREQRFSLLIVIMALTVLSGIIGLLQVVSAPDGPLYFHTITNNGSAVGLFANRNHQAMLLGCMFPMLAVFASAGIKTVEQNRFRIGIAVAVGLVLVPLLLVTGSRAGLVIGFLGLCSVPLLYREPKIAQPAKRKFKRKVMIYMIGVFGVLTLVILTILFSRAQAFDRITATDQLEGLRFATMGPVFAMGWKYFPFGSGVGSFVEVYQIDEPLHLLSTNYFNHAHNDWLEVFMTAGLFGLVLLGGAIVFWVVCSRSAWRSPLDQTRDIPFARLGSILMLLIAIASAGDYPLRIPSIMCFAVIVAVWLAGTRSPHTAASKNSGSF